MNSKARGMVEGEGEGDEEVVVVAGRGGGRRDFRRRRVSIGARRFFARSRFC
jgi:hypothetical protein